MKNISCYKKNIADQRGMALVSALLLLLIVSLMALGMSTDTSMDVRISAYQKFKTRSWGFGASGMLAASDILEDNIHDAGWDQSAPNNPFSYPNLSADYVAAANGDDIMVQMTTKPDTPPTNPPIPNPTQHGVFYMDDNPYKNVVMEMRGDLSSDVSTQRILSKLAKGGAIQLAAGYAGFGKGLAGGGSHIIYNVESLGTDSDNARSRLALHYRHVTK